jgi:hypothetical protein
MSISKSSRDHIAAALLADAIKNLTDFHGKNPAAMLLGKLGGLKGGKARAAALTPRRRKEIAIAAANIRWERWRFNRDAAATNNA